MSKKILSVSLSLVMALVAVFSCFSFVSAKQNNGVIDISGVTVVNGEAYSSPEEVAAYLYKFHKLPCNYVTKSEAKSSGWVPRRGNLQKVIPGASIGGDWFTNYQELLPVGYHWNECDVNYHGGRRGAERLLFNDECTMVYYTGDHYTTATLIEK